MRDYKKFRKNITNMNIIKNTKKYKKIYERLPHIDSSYKTCLI